MDEASRIPFESSSGPVSGPPDAHDHLVGAVRMLEMAVHETIEASVQKELAGDRLSPAQWKLLEIFARAEVTNVTEVAAYQGVSTAAASKAVDRLVRIGLLTREEDQEDRRHIRLSLSEEGKSLASQYIQLTTGRLREVLRFTSNESIRRLTGDLEDLVVAVLRASSLPADRICLQCGLNGRERCLVEESMQESCQFHTIHRPTTRLAPAQSVVR